MFFFRRLEATLRELGLGKSVLPSVRHPGLLSVRLSLPRFLLVADICFEGLTGMATFLIDILFFFYFFISCAVGGPSGLAGGL